MTNMTVRSVTRLTSYLLNADPDMTVSKVHLFLLISRGEDVLVRDLVRQTGMAQSTVARIVSALADKPLRGKKNGLGWVVAMPDPDDPRRVLINITSKGRKVIADIENLGD